MRSRLANLVALLLLVGLVAALCGSDKKNDASSSTAPKGTTTTAEQITATLAGSGSTFQKSYDEAVIEAFKSDAGASPSTTAVGLRKGQDRSGRRVDPVGRHRQPVKDEDLPKFTGGAILYFPTVAAPITLSYNVSGVDELRARPPTLAQIYQEQDQDLERSRDQAHNPGANLPSTKITPVHRSDASGTTSNFTKWLTAAAPGVFTLTAGDSLELAGR